MNHALAREAIMATYESLGYALSEIRFNEQREAHAVDSSIGDSLSQQSTELAAGHIKLAISKLEDAARIVTQHSPTNKTDHAKH